MSALTKAQLLDAQKRLQSLGILDAHHDSALMDDQLRNAFVTFAQEQGLGSGAVVDLDLYEKLRETTHDLGSRLLFFRTPHMRGADIRRLQELLALLGFNPGTIDGIFGPRTRAAVSDFQANCTLPVDGTLTHATLVELERLSSRSEGRTLVTEIHDAITPETTDL